jgi:hypothetical protein
VRVVISSHPTSQEIDLQRTQTSLPAAFKTACGSKIIVTSRAKAHLEAHPEGEIFESTWAEVIGSRHQF